MATTISRTHYDTLVDDDGSGTTGSVWDKADVDAMLDAFDAVLANPVTFGSTISSEGFGTHQWSAGGTGFNQLRLRNTTNGAGNGSMLMLGNDASASCLEIRALATGFTTSGQQWSASGLVEGTQGSGLVLAATHANGPLAFFANGATLRAQINAGLQVGAPTGGDKGAGTINCVACYDDNVLLTDFAFDLAFDEQTAHPLPSWFTGLLSLEDVERVAKAERRLPWMPTRDEFEQARTLGGMVSRLWFGQEQQQLYLFDLARRLSMLEARAA